MNEGAVCEIDISGASFTGLMEAVLARGAAFRFKARGFSMWPFIRDKDIVTLVPAKYGAIGAGDVVAAVRPGCKKTIVHRIVGRQGGHFIIKGDNCRGPDGVFDSGRIPGVVQMVERNGVKAWFGGGAERRLVALASRAGLFDRLLMPVLRIYRQRRRADLRGINE